MVFFWVFLGGFFNANPALEHLVSQKIYSLHLVVYISGRLRYMKAKQILGPCWKRPSRVTYRLTLHETVSVNSFIYYSFWYFVFQWRKCRTALWQDLGKRFQVLLWSSRRSFKGIVQYKHQATPLLSMNNYVYSTCDQQEWKKEATQTGINRIK